MTAIVYRGGTRWSTGPHLRLQVQGQQLPRPRRGRLKTPHRRREGTLHSRKPEAGLHTATKPTPTRDTGQADKMRGQLRCQFSREKWRSLNAKLVRLHQTEGRQQGRHLRTWTAYYNIYNCRWRTAYVEANYILHKGETSSKRERPARARLKMGFHFWKTNNDSSQKRTVNAANTIYNFDREKDNSFGRQQRGDPSSSDTTPSHPIIGKASCLV